MGPGGSRTPPVLASKHGALGAPYGPTVPLRECRRQFTLVFKVLLELCDSLVTSGLVLAD